MIIEYDWYTKEIIRSNPKVLFVFGDNTIRSGLGGQAKVCRGESNVFGIATKKAPYSFFDGGLDDWIVLLSDLSSLMKLAKRYPIGWPRDGVGTGLAELDKRCPDMFKLIEHAKKVIDREKNVEPV